MSLRVGVDVGGTYTDAVVLDDRQLLASAKRPTSGDVTNGIVEALTAANDESGMSRSAVQRVMIGTTHFTNAVIQRRGLLRTGIIRLGYPPRRRCCLHSLIGLRTFATRLLARG